MPLCGKSPSLNSRTSNHDDTHPTSLPARRDSGETRIRSRRGPRGGEGVGDKDMKTENKKTVHVTVVLEIELPATTDTKSLNLGLAGAVIMSRWEHIADAKLHTWWIEEIAACNNQYINCHRCNKVELVYRDAVILDGKPLCLICSAEFKHGNPPELAHRAEQPAQP